MKKATLYIDARDFYKVRDGKSRVCTEWIQNALSSGSLPWNICLVSQEKIDPSLLGSASQLLIPARGLLWHYKLHRFLKRQSKLESLAYFSMNSYFGPVFSRGAYPVAILVHDLIALLYAQNHSWKARFIESFLLRKACRFADKIFCVSQATRHDLLTFLGEAHFAEKTKLFPLAVSKENFFPVEGLVESHPDHAYLLFVGNPIPRKNLDFVLKVLDGSMKEAFSTMHLVVTGSKEKEKNHYQKWIKKYHPLLEGRVHFLAVLDEASLRRYYQEAHALVFPSFYEGFGLPILEAMACACPVIYHEASSMKEIAQNAGLGFHLQEKELESAILSLFDTETRVIWKRRALQRASEFDWNESLHTFIHTFLNDYVSRKESPDA